MHAKTYLLPLTGKHHFLEDIVRTWCERAEDEDEEAQAGAVVAMPLLLHRLAVTNSRCPRLRSHLKAKSQPRIHCRLRIPGRVHSSDL